MYVLRERKRGNTPDLENQIVQICALQIFSIVKNVSYIFPQMKKESEFIRKPA